MEDLRLGEEREELEGEERFVGISRFGSLVEVRLVRAWDELWRLFLEVDKAGFCFVLRLLLFSLNGSMMVSGLEMDSSRY